LYIATEFGDHRRMTTGSRESLWPEKKRRKGKAVEAAHAAAKDPLDQERTRLREEIEHMIKGWIDPSCLKPLLSDPLRTLCRALQLVIITPKELREGFADHQQYFERLQYGSRVRKSAQFKNFLPDIFADYIRQHRPEWEKAIREREAAVEKETGTPATDAREAVMRLFPPPGPPVTQKTLFE
jgi:hypothetical protein